MTKKWLDAHSDYLIREYTQGRTISDLSREFGVTYKVVARIIKNAGFTTRKTVAYTLPESDIITDYCSGVSENMVAKRYSVSRNVIRRVLRDNGIKRRNQSQSETIKWANMTPEQRSKQVSAANRAAKGRKRTLEERMKLAQSKESNKTIESPYERKMLDALRNRGADPVIQKAIGVHNADFTIGSVAVEVWAGGFHFYGRHAAMHERRIRNILNAGYHVIVTWFDNGLGFSADCADDVIRFCEFSSANPSSPRQYRMVRRGHELLAACSEDSDYIPLKPSFGGCLDF